MASLLQLVGHPPPLQLNLPSTPPNKPKPLNFSYQKPIPSPKVASFPSLSSNQAYVNSSTYATVLESCRSSRLGKQVHAHTLKNGFQGHEFVETKLLRMYGKCGCLDDAVQLFEKMSTRNLYSWTAILNVCIDNGLFEEGLLLYQGLLMEDLELDFFVFPVVLKISSGFGRVELGKQLHGIVIKNGFVSNTYVGNALIDMYGKCGSLDDAFIVWNNMVEKDRVSWNTIITACAANGMVLEALEFLHRMSFEDGLAPNLISWSAVIGGFSQNGYDEEAIETLRRMQAARIEPHAQTLASVLPACARLQSLSLGKAIHGYSTRHRFMTNSFVVNGLIDVYRRCSDMESCFKIFSKFSVKNEVSFNTMIVGYCENGDISYAKELFDQMEVAGVKRGIISWNSMISGYVDNSMFNEGLGMFQDLLMQEDIETDSFTLGSALAACANMGSLNQGKEIHSHAVIRGLQSNPYVAGALVEVYCKCKDLKAAQSAFDDVAERDIATWNALISGYARCNQMENVQINLQKMKEDGYDPNVYTWNGIIAGHVENGLNESALQLFSEMQSSGQWIRAPYELGCAEQSISALDQGLSQTDSLPISMRQISRPEALLCLHVLLPLEAADPEERELGARLAESGLERERDLSVQPLLLKRIDQLSGRRFRLQTVAPERLLQS
ncbi:hypothetical protein RJ639_032698 [Escallonia herrerae]|uniref:Pentatricopeptide repeat-containing protein n=1 Tax=Escallonia herrerae TaxID=1293975 RepID=A0AA88X9S5_9ASTE|nr:hypothetical protein RJ639_032698 [Escallonia herrerae]